MVSWLYLLSCQEKIGLTHFLRKQRSIISIIIIIIIIIIIVFLLASYCERPGGESVFILKKKLAGKFRIDPIGVGQPVQKQKK